MAILVDTSYVYALHSPRDAYHSQAKAFAANRDETVVVNEVILPEVGFLFRRDFGNRALIKFLAEFRKTRWRFESLRQSDLDRVYEIAQQYASSRFDVVDCCIMAMAERLNITRIATFDHRDFGIFKPRHIARFELVP